VKKGDWTPPPATLASKSRLAALIAALSLAGCTAPAPQQLVNPASASQYCEAQGGKRTMERGSGGEIGVCVFADNRQCEEWALLLGQCPRGGIPVTGYATTSERHCAIRGGRMTIPGCALSPVGVYETRNVMLVLQAGRTAMLTTAYSGVPSRYLVPGRWESSGNIVTVSTEHERLVFDYSGDRLVPREWDRKMWGEAGPGTLLRQN
jgi:putative hemolysin